MSGINYDLVWSEEPHYVYMCLDRDNGVIYVGRTKDVRKRMAQHKTRSPDMYLRTKRVVQTKYDNFQEAQGRRVSEAPPLPTILQQEFGVTA